MPTMRFEKPDDPVWVAREKLIAEVLPKTPIIADKIHDGSFVVSKRELTEALIKEIEIYKAFPREGEYKPDDFNPRNTKACFMGQGFKDNGSGFEGWYDYDLVRYRNAVGRINHQTWGNCTLLEIWGGDHFEKHKQMVLDVFKYCNGEIPKLPKVKFYINPLYENGRSGTWDPHPDEVHQKAHRAHLLKVANYCEIRDRMKKAGVKNPLELGLTEEDDPKPRKKNGLRPS